MKALILEQLSACGVVSFPTNDAVSRHHLVFELLKLAGDSKLLRKRRRINMVLGICCCIYVVDKSHLSDLCNEYSTVQELWRYLASLPPTGTANHCGLFQRVGANA